MRLKDCICVLTTMIIILIWCFSINWSYFKDVKRSRNRYEVNSRVTGDSKPDCVHPGLFKSHFGCCPHKNCPVDHFSFHLRSGAANAVPPKICVNNTIIMGGIRNNAGDGLNIVLVNGETGEVLRKNYFNMETGDVEELLSFLKTITPGNIVLVASHIDPATQMTDEIRDIFAGLGSSMIKSVKPRDSWVFAGASESRNASPFEKVIHSDLDTNVYEDWPEMGEIVGCLPRKQN